MQGVGCRVQGLGFTCFLLLPGRKVKFGFIGFRVRVGSRVQGSGFRVQPWCPPSLPHFFLELVPGPRMADGGTSGLGLRALRA